MNSQKTIKELLREKNNDYSRYELFTDTSPIPSSVIIPAYNGGRQLKRTLENLARQISVMNNSSKFEVIVIDDGSNEDLYSIFKDVKFACPSLYARHIHNQGRSSARNFGINISSKELLFLFDADVLLPNNYFEESWAVHNNIKNAVVVGLAQNVYSDDPTCEVTSTEEVNLDITDDFRYKKILEGKEFRLIEETDWFKQFGHYRTIGPWTLSNMVVTHNLSVRKDVAREVRGFDERFRTWGYEDSNFGAKLISSGSYIVPLKNTGIIRIIQRNPKRKFSIENRELYEKLLDEFKK